MLLEILSVVAAACMLLILVIIQIFKENPVVVGRGEPGQDEPRRDEPKLDEPKITLIDNDSKTKLAEEYFQWKLAQEIFKITCQTATSTTGNKGCASSLEVFLMMMRERNLLVKSDVQGIFYDIPISSPEYVKLARGLEKSGHPTAGEAIKKIHELITSSLKSADENKKNIIADVRITPQISDSLPKILSDLTSSPTSPASPEPIVPIEPSANVAPAVVSVQKMVTCGEFRQKISSNIERMIEMAGLENTTLCLLRYSAILAGSMQWGCPQKFYDHAYDKWGVRIEGFASPLNSRLMGKKDAFFCSLFPDVDKPFGSIGDYFSVKPKDHPGAWVVNPPFINIVMTASIQKTLIELTEMRSGDTPLVIYYIGIKNPAPIDKTYAPFDASPFVHARVLFEPKTYFFEKPDGTRIPANFHSIMYCLNSHEGLEVSSPGNRPPQSLPDADEIKKLFL